ncbi:MAG: hypothetical protein ABL908_07910 [Hyphomicrobium sp.]
MRFISILLAALIVAMPADAADLAGKAKPVPAPVAVDPQAAAPKHDAGQFSGFYAEGSVSLLAAESGSDSTTLERFGIGVGYDRQMGNLIFGGLLRGDFGDANSLILGARAGYAINPHLMAYGITTLEMDTDNLSLGDGVLALGVGIETYVFGKNTTAFFEATRDVATFGDFKGLDSAISARIGARHRF